MVGLGSGVTTVAAGLYHTCAVTTDGGLKCWGRDRHGQLGDGNTTDSWVPVDVVGMASGATGVDIGYDHTCALAGNGRVKCWGRDEYGQLGIGTTDRWLTPVDAVESPRPALTVNYPFAQPGSYVTVTGWNFPPGSEVTVEVNGQALTTVTANPGGGFILFLETSGADPGRYVVSAGDGQVAPVQFALNGNAPLRVQEGGGQTVAVPDGIALPWYLVYLAKVIG